MQCSYLTPPAPAQRKRMAASDCLIGRNRKARKAYCRALFNNDFSACNYRLRIDPIYLKRIRREARHQLYSHTWY